MARKRTGGSNKKGFSSPLDLIGRRQPLLGPPLWGIPAASLWLPSDVAFRSSDIVSLLSIRQPLEHPPIYSGDRRASRQRCFDDAYWNERQSGAMEQQRRGLWGVAFGLLASACHIMQPQFLQLLHRRRSLERDSGINGLVEAPSPCPSSTRPT